MKSKLEGLVEKRSTVVDDELHQDLVSIMEDNQGHVNEQYPPDSFQQVFWKQQRRANNLKKQSSMRWDPLMIRWCLYLRSLSGSAYELLRSSGVVSLPSQRTLRDYTYYTAATTGFSGDLCSSHIH